MSKGFELTEQQIRLLEKANPEFAERHVKSEYPGYADEIVSIQM